MSAKDLERVEAAERDELARRTDVYGSRFVDLTGRTALVVDDGVATGASAVAACRAVRARHADRVVLAVPVAPERFIAPADAVDDFVCPHRESDFWAVGEYYDHFGQTSDREVVALLLAAAGSGR
jgi:putative phosphoribosyl transferase